MRAIDLINPAGEIAKECKIAFTATPKKLNRWKEIQKKYAKELTNGNSKTTN